ncbi:MAG: S8 family serine peptidase [Bacteroidetes bacterium]|nr:S8 family serine peptidase [Bacteroidota bacterium]
MKKITNVLLLFIIFTKQYSFSQSLDSYASINKEPQVISSRLTPDAYLLNTIIIKVKPEFRNIVSNNKINHLQLEQIFTRIGVSSLQKKFPNDNPPEKLHNALGQPYVDLSLIYELTYLNAIPIKSVINQLLATNILDFAEPHFIAHKMSFTPNDPSISSQTAFLTRINAYNAWDLGLGGSQGTASVVIGIVDSGSDMNHPDLVSQYYHNVSDPVNGLDDDSDGYIDNYTGYDLAGADYNNIVGDNNPDIQSSNTDHGSLISGVAGASTNNNIGIAGVGFNCTLLPVKCSADNNLSSDIVTGYEGVKYAADHGAKIISCAWGFTTGGVYGQMIIDYATINKNCLVVAAAGNSAIQEKIYPASYNHVLAVASTNSSSDSKASFTSYDYSVDLCAPGVSIYTTKYDDAYSTASGTSLSSAIVAGGAGLVQSKFNYSNALQIGERLRQTTDNIYSVGGNAAYQDKLGKGRLNLYRALTDPSGPSVVFTNQVITDHNDNVFLIGDTLFISADFINYLAPTTNLTASLTVVTGGTYVTAIDDNSSIGVINTLSTVNNNADVFRFKVNTGTPSNAIVRFKVMLNDGSYSDNYYFDVVLLSTPVASYSISSPKCSGSTISFTDQSTGTPTAWSWSFPGGVPATSTTQNPIVTYTSSGTYSVTLVASNASGASSPMTNTFVVNPTPAIAVNSGTISAGQSFTMTPSGAMTYTFSSGSAVVTPTSTTSYTVTGTSSAGCVSLVGAVSNVTVIPTCSVPTVTVTGGGNFCLGQSKTLTATGSATSYTWMPGGATTSSITVTPTVTMVYTLTASNGGTCTITNTVQLIANTNPVISTSASPSTVCAGASSNLTAAGATSYTWSTGALTNTTVVTPSITTTYSVIGRSVVGCTTTKTITVNVNATPTVVCSNTGTICAGASNTITAFGASTYTWSTGQTSYSIVVSPTTTTTYSVLGTSAQGCVSTFTTVNTVSVNAAPTVIVNSGGVCLGNSYTLTASGATSYTWSTAAMSASIVVSPTTTTNYSVVGSTSGGCTSTNTAIATVTVSLPPTLAVNSGSICYGNSFTMTPSGASTYTYSGGTAIVSPTANATYTVTGTNSFGCVGSPVVSSVTVSSGPTLSILSNPNVSCLGNTTTLTVSGATSYSWSTGATTSSIVVNPLTNTVYTATGSISGCSSTKTIAVNPIDIVLSASVTNIACNVSVNSGSISLLPGGGTFPYYYSWSNGATTANIKNLAVGSYSVLVSDANGCVDSLQLAVTRPISLTVNTSIVSPACGANDGQISSTVSGGTSPYTYIWNSGATTPVASSLTPGQYIVQVYDASNCYGSAIVNLNPTNGPVVTIGTTNSVSCYGGNNGSTSINVSGGQAPVTTQWSNGSTSNAISGLTAGVYDVIVTDGSGCKVNESIMIDQPSGLNIQPLVTRPNCAQSNGAMGTIMGVHKLSE